jgi:hypothetical protein
MNTLPFTSLATTTIAALTFFTGSKSPDTSVSEPPHKSDVVAVAPLQSWDETMNAMDVNAEAFRISTSKQIEDYARLTQAMSSRTEPSRIYLQTRSQALREQIDYARAELQKLPSSQGDPAFTPAHAHFYRTMSGLHDAFVQLQDEVGAGAVVPL